MDDQQLQSDGPVFETGSGWGGKIKLWLKKHNYKLALFVIIVLAVLLGIVFSSRKQYAVDNGGLSASGKKSYDQMIIRGDDLAHIARRAVIQYLADNPAELARGQKVYIENKLTELIKNIPIVTGKTVKFSADDIGNIISQSQKLTPTQMEKWGVYGGNINY